MRLRKQALKQHKKNVIEECKKAQVPEPTEFYWGRIHADHPFFVSLFVAFSAGSFSDVSVGFDERIVHEDEHHGDMFRKCAMKIIKQYLKARRLPRSLATRIYDHACQIAETKSERSGSEPEGTANLEPDPGSAEVSPWED